MSDSVAAPVQLTAGRRWPRSGASLVAQGQPMMWLTAGALGIALAMTLGLLLLILVRGLYTFWPAPLSRFELVDGTVYQGEVTRSEKYRMPADALESLPASARQAAEVRLASQSGWSIEWTRCSDTLQ